MKRFFLSLTLAISALAPAAALAGQRAPRPPSTGLLMTLTLGRYDCEMPGAPGSAGFVARPEESFKVTSSSRYVGPDGRYGTYLFTGDTITMTSGALEGMRLVRVRERFLRKIEDNGIPGELRCILARSSDKH